jgi:hypothetical protein
MRLHTDFLFTEAAQRTGLQVLRLFRGRPALRGRGGASPRCQFRFLSNPLMRRPASRTTFQSGVAQLIATAETLVLM